MVTTHNISSPPAAILELNCWRINCSAVEQTFQLAAYLLYMDGLRFDGWQKNGMEISNEVIFLNEKKKRKRKIDELDTAGYDM